MWSESVQSSPTFAFKHDATSEITFLDLAYRCKVNWTSTLSVKGPTRRTFAKLGATGFPCWHFLSAHEPTSVAGLLMSCLCPFYVHCGCLTQEGRCWQDLDSFLNICTLSVEADVFTVQSHATTITHALRRFGLWRVWPIVCHLLSGGNSLAEIFTLEYLHSLKRQRFLFPSFDLTFLGEVNKWGCLKPVWGQLEFII